MKLKTFTAKELRTKKPADIDKYIVELEQQQVEHNQALYTNKDNKTHQIKVLKKAIARAYTIKTIETVASTGKEK